MLTFITIQALGPEWHRERGHSRQRNYSDKKHRKKNDKILPQCENVKISRIQIFCFQNVNVNTTNVPHNNDDNVGGERSNVTNETLLPILGTRTHTHPSLGEDGWDSRGEFEVRRRVSDRRRDNKGLTDAPDFKEHLKTIVDVCSNQRSILRRFLFFCRVFCHF